MLAWAMILVAFSLFIATGGNAAKRAKVPTVLAPPDDSPCGKVDQQIVADFKAFISAHQECHTDTDCALAKTDCPLGCTGVAVTASAVGKTESLSEELLRKAGRQGCTCSYRCRPPRRAECKKGLCSNGF
jgi:hypothetical protein